MDQQDSARSTAPVEPNATSEPLIPSTEDKKSRRRRAALAAFENAELERGKSYASQEELEQAFDQAWPRTRLFLIVATIGIVIFIIYKFTTGQ